MESILSYYTSHWNPAFAGDTAALSRKISLACDVISNSVNKLDILNVPYYLIENVKKAVCAQADSFGISLVTPPSPQPEETESETESESEPNSGSSSESSSGSNSSAVSESADISYKIGSFSYSEKSSSSSKNSSGSSSSGSSSSGSSVDVNGLEIRENLYFGEKLTLCDAARSYLINTGLLNSIAVVA